MYYLAIAKFNPHVATFGPSKDKMVDNDSYRQVAGGPKSMQGATEQIARLLKSEKPGTKIKLVITVPEKQPSEMSLEELRAKVAEMEADAAKASQAA
jgi:hypothetical protein